MDFMPQIILVNNVPLLPRTNELRLSKEIDKIRRSFKNAEARVLLLRNAEAIVIKEALTTWCCAAQENETDVFILAFQLYKIIFETLKRGRIRKTELAIFFFIYYLYRFQLSVWHLLQQLSSEAISLKQDLSWILKRRLWQVFSWRNRHKELSCLSSHLQDFPGNRIFISSLFLQWKQLWNEFLQSSWEGFVSPDNQKLIEEAC